jgi:ribose 5-phosphate isomerase B
MKIFIGGDHAGFELKEKIIKYLTEQNYSIEDMGAFNLNQNDDYPDFIIPVAKAVSLNKNSFGIVLGGSGQGEQIAANKIDEVRAIEYYGGNLEIVKLGREHNNANVLSLGARFINEQEAMEAIKVFLNTKFSEEERHERRLKEINKIEENN